MILLGYGARNVDISRIRQCMRTARSDPELDPRVEK